MMRKIIYLVMKKELQLVVEKSSLILTLLKLFLHKHLGHLYGFSVYRVLAMKAESS